MIKIPLFLSALFFSSTLLAGGGKLESARNKLITCAFRDIEQRRGGHWSYTHSAQMLEEFIKHKDDAKELLNLKERCNQERKAQNTARDIAWKDLNEAWLKVRSAYTPKVAEIIDQWMWPVAKCSFFGAGAFLALHHGTAVGQLLMHCQADNGLKFIGLVGLHDNDVQGGGLNVLLMGGRTQFQIHSLEDNELSSSSHTVGAGIAVGVGDNNWIGIGIGAGATSNGQKIGKIRRLIPTGFDFKGVKKTLL